MNGWKHAVISKPFRAFALRSVASGNRQLRNLNVRRTIEGQPLVTGMSTDRSTPADIIIHVVANFKAGLLPRNSSREILASFSRYPHVTCRIDDCQDPGGTPASVDRALETSAQIVVAAGGDGTVSSVADLLVGKNVELGVLPLGTFNNFAKDLGIPLDLDRAVDTVCAGMTTPIDLGEVNGRYFINNVSLGAYPKVVQLRDRLRKFIGKWPAMIPAILFVLLRMPWFRVHMEWNGHRTRRFVPLLFVGNNPYETTWPEVGRRQGIGKGVLWLMFFKKLGFFSVMRDALPALSGRIWKAEDLEVLETTELTVRSSRHRLTVALDGETFRQHTPLIFRSHHAALKVRVPSRDEYAEDLK
ncbi:MAG: diacylglycerol kinase family protein [Desulfomonilaceae bacterium]|nr:diacylglycerol kinase family protein [Desulfomonilaceae bacterium]